MGRQRKMNLRKLRKSSQRNRRNTRREKMKAKFKSNSKIKAGSTWSKLVVQHTWREGSTAGTNQQRTCSSKMEVNREKA